jgi:hypothetical protein
MSLARQTETLPSLQGLGKRPLATPAHQALFEIGIMGVTPDFLSPMMSFNRKNLSVVILNPVM